MVLVAVQGRSMYGKSHKEASAIKVMGGSGAGAADKAA
jgi:hypothetical protein